MMIQLTESETESETRMQTDNRTEKLNRGTSVCRGRGEGGEGGDAAVNRHVRIKTYKDRKETCQIALAEATHTQQQQQPQHQCDD